MKKLIAWSVIFVLGSGLMGLAQDKGGQNALEMHGLSKSVAGATKEHPFENSLGMKFVPVPGTTVLFSIWDTRVEDYRAYSEAKSGVDASWKKPGFKQWDDHPVVNVNWKEAKAFCEWLTRKEQNEGKIGRDEEYRLPTDDEWSVAVGKGKYPWGDQWPPPKGAGNYSFTKKVADYEKTSPVGTFAANDYGLYDMGGNVWQWCEDWYRLEMDQDAMLDKFSWLKENDGERNYRVLRGASWDCGDAGVLLSSAHGGDRPVVHSTVYGFRCVLVLTRL